MSLFMSLRSKPLKELLSWLTLTGSSCSGLGATPASPFHYVLYVASLQTALKTNFLPEFPSLESVGSAR
jgi:hypothetical protein